MPSYIAIFKLNDFDDIIFDKITTADEESAKREATRKFVWLYGAPATFCIDEIIIEEI